MLAINETDIVPSGILPYAYERFPFALRTVKWKVLQDCIRSKFFVCFAGTDRAYNPSGFYQSLTTSKSIDISPFTLLTTFFEYIAVCAAFLNKFIIMGNNQYTLPVFGCLTKHTAYKTEVATIQPAGRFIKNHHRPVRQ